MFSFQNKRQGIQIFYILHFFILIFAQGQEYMRRSGIYQNISGDIFFIVVFIINYIPEFIIFIIYFFNGCSGYYFPAHLFELLRHFFNQDLSPVCSWDIAERFGKFLIMQPAADP